MVHVRHHPRRLPRLNFSMFELALGSRRAMTAYVACTGSSRRGEQWLHATRPHREVGAGYSTTHHRQSAAEAPRHAPRRQHQEQQFAREHPESAGGQVRRCWPRWRGATFWAREPDHPKVFISAKPHPDT